MVKRYTDEDYEALEKKCDELEAEKKQVRMCYDNLTKQLTESEAVIEAKDKLIHDWIERHDRLENMLMDVFGVLEKADRSLYQHKDAVKNSLNIIKALTEGKE